MPVVLASASDKYDFPIKGGSPKWAAFNNHNEMIEATQIPGALLDAMSTEGLVETCLSYPLLGDINAYDSPQLGFDAVALNFNGLNALMSRKDAASILLKKYKEMDPEAIGYDWELLKKGLYASEFDYIEILLSQYGIQAKLTKEERDELVEQTRTKSEGKLRQVDVFGFTGQERTKMIAGRIFQKVGSVEFSTKINQKDSLRDYLQHGVTAEPDCFIDIDIETDNYLRNLKKEGRK
jgi:hypothetical protein